MQVQKYTLDYSGSSEAPISHDKLYLKLFAPLCVTNDFEPISATDLIILYLQFAFGGCTNSHNK